MQLSIVIVNYRSWVQLRAALAALGRGAAFPRDDWEIVVVDNASGDGTLAAFRNEFPGVRFIENSGNHGFAHACNRGAQAAGGELLLFMNPDVIATPEALQRMAAAKRAHPEIGILTVGQRDRDGRRQKAFDRFPDLLLFFRTVKGLLRRLAPSGNPDPRRSHEGPVMCDWVSGSLLLISREDFDRLGGWSEDFWMYAEDTDLCLRAARLGLRSGYSPVAEVVHLHGGASRRDNDTTVLTKTEAMISSHVYVQRNFEGGRRVANHGLLVLRNLAPLMVAAVFNGLTAGRVPALRLRATLCGALVSYYRRVAREGTWLSPRSVRHPARQGAASGRVAP